MRQICVDLMINLFAGILVFLLGLFWPVIPKSYRKFLLRRFWGKGVLGDDFAITYGEYEVVRTTPYPYQKRYLDGRTHRFVGPWRGIVAGAEIRASSYLINTLGAHRESPVPVTDDMSAVASLDKTYISLGSPSSNQMTEFMLRQPENVFFEFGQEKNGEEGTRAFILDKRSDRKIKGFQEPVRKDYGVVLKIPNRRFPGHFFFVCAGLGEWGTSGGSWYLATKWRDLQSEFHDDAFGVVVEVEIGSDESARRIFPEEQKVPTSR